MKRVIAVAISLLFLLSSCSLDGIFKNNLSDEEIADQTAQRIINAVKDENATALKALFSATVQKEHPDLDSQCNRFIQFICEEILSISTAREAGVGMDSSVEKGKVQKTVQSSFCIVTTGSTYYMTFKECVRNDLDEDLIGLSSLYIISANDWNAEYVYRGDGKWTPGINIGAA